MSLHLSEVVEIPQKYRFLNLLGCEMLRQDAKKALSIRCLAANLCRNLRARAADGTETDEKKRRKNNLKVLLN